MGGSPGNPGKRWGLRHTGAAATILTVGQFYAFQEVFITRKEAEAQVKRMDRHEVIEREDNKAILTELKEVRKDLEKLTITIYKQGGRHGR